MRLSIIFAASLLVLSATLVGCNQSSNTTEPLATPAAPDPAEAEQVSFANAKCPIMGGTPTAELTTEYAGKTIGFCCDGCPQKFEALSDEEKAEKFAAVQIDDGGPSHDHATQDDSSHEPDQHDSEETDE